MAALIEKNDCMHRGVCKYAGDGMCLTECGHYTMETQNTDNQQLKAEIRALSAELQEDACGYQSEINLDYFIIKMRDLSAV